jgi:hypothetical protein
MIISSTRFKLDSEKARTKPIRWVLTKIFWLLLIFPVAVVVGYIPCICFFGDKGVAYGVLVGLVVASIFALVIIFRKAYFKVLLSSWLLSGASCLVIGPFGLIPGLYASVPLILVVCTLGDAATVFDPSPGGTYNSGEVAENNGESFWKLGGLARRYLNHREDKRQAEAGLQYEEQQEKQALVGLVEDLAVQAISWIAAQDPQPRQVQPRSLMPPPGVADRSFNSTPDSRDRSTTWPASPRQGLQGGDVGLWGGFEKSPPGSWGASGDIPSRDAAAVAYSARDRSSGWSTTVSGDSVGNLIVRNPNSPYATFATPNAGGGYTVWGGSGSPTSISHDFAGNIIVRSPNSPYATFATPNAGGGYTLWGGSGGRPTSISEDAAGNVTVREPTN